MGATSTAGRPRQSLPEDSIADRRTFSEESGGIVFLAVRKK
ncbi:MAG TPA: hypothetical protein VI589_05195 [Vicinamibacteria bacterium]